VATGIEALVKALMGNPTALETCWLSVITFSKTAAQVVPLTELMDFKPPRLSVRTGTSLGAAIKLLIDCLEREITATTEEVKGDYRALVFLMTDGQPTDNWEPAVEKLRARPVSKKIANLYTIGCGQDVDLDILRRISDIVLWLNELTPAKIQKLFVWLSASVKRASETGNKDVKPEEIELPPFLKDARASIPEIDRPRGKLERQVFMHSRCVRKKLPYLMRYTLDPGGQYYRAVSSHTLDSMDPGDEQDLKAIKSSMLRGCPPCPYCGNPGVVVCSCGAIFCFSHEMKESKEPVFCPGCNSPVTNITEDAVFDVEQTQG
jgi:uncharacterized protein YegL